MERGGKAAVNAEYLGGDYGGYGKAVEDIDKGLPYLDVTPSLALVVKAVHLSLV